MTFKAGNKLIQSSAARQTKMAMRAMWREKIVPLIQLHDEFGVSYNSEEQGKHVVQIMRDCVKLVVPVIVDMEYGVDWGAATVRKDNAGVVTYDASWAAAQKELMEKNG
jgi:DNA polymerase I-like protein with 3'-5' exonuclease and polymerase domains